MFWLKWIFFNWFDLLGLDVIMIIDFFKRCFFISLVYSVVVGIFLFVLLEYFLCDKLVMKFFFEYLLNLLIIIKIFLGWFIMNLNNVLLRFVCLFKIEEWFKSFFKLMGLLLSKFNWWKVNK